MEVVLNRYEQWHRLKLDPSGNLILRDPRIANKIRMNAEPFKILKR